jgi:hypothetical protein
MVRRVRPGARGEGWVGSEGLWQTDAEVVEAAQEHVAPFTDVAACNA